MRGYCTHTRVLAQIDTGVHTQPAANSNTLRYLLYVLSAGSSVMEQTMGAKATAMDPHLHKTCSLLAASIHIQTGRLKPCHIVSK